MLQLSIRESALAACPRARDALSSEIAESESAVLARDHIAEILGQITSGAVAT